MAFREVRVFEVREVLRLWLAGEGIRATERLVGFDRKTVRRYVDAAVGLGLIRDGGDEQLSDGFIGLVVEAVRPHRLDGHGEAWRLCQTRHDEIAAWVEDDLTAVKIGELLARRGVEIPCRTVQRYVAEFFQRLRSARREAPGFLLGDQRDRVVEPDGEDVIGRSGDGGA